MARTYAITGVASGIGAELASKLSQAGHKVVGFDVQACIENMDDFISLDLNNASAIAVGAEQTPWPLDGLCNNAGVPPRAGMEQTILQVNFLRHSRFYSRYVAAFEARSINREHGLTSRPWLADNIEQIKAR